MIVYGDRKETHSTWDWLLRIRRCEDALEAFIDWTELEAGLPPDEALCDASLAAARWLRTGDAKPFRDAINRPLDLPSTFEYGTSEGYAWYALHPLDYIQPAKWFFTQRRPDSVTVIGLRSIGTGLSAVVASEIADLGCNVNRATVRPAGHPFDRRTNLDCLELGTSWYAVVDEGPGLSGSSMASVASALIERGIAQNRIVFMPANKPDTFKFVSRAAARIWESVSVFPASPPKPMPGEDISGGQWRRVLHCDVLVHPQHEMRKSIEGDSWFKFAGYGRYGSSKWKRSQANVQGIETIRPRRLVNGYFEYPFFQGTCGFNSTALQIGAYVGSRTAQRFESPADRTLEMMMANCDGLPEIGYEAARDGFAAENDGRILPHEFVTTATGCLKSDDLDHCCDHFFPGRQDPAWDLAAAEIELNCPRAELLKGYSETSGDKDVRHRLKFYRAAYLAYKTAYAQFCSQSLNQWTSEHQRYHRLLQEELA